MQQKEWDCSSYPLLSRAMKSHLPICFGSELWYKALVLSGQINDVKGILLLKTGCQNHSDNTFPLYKSLWSGVGVILPPPPVGSVHMCWQGWYRYGALDQLMKQFCQPSVYLVIIFPIKWLILRNESPQEIILQIVLLIWLIKHSFMQ